MPPRKVAPPAPALPVPGSIAAAATPKVMPSKAGPASAAPAAAPVVVTSLAAAPVDAQLARLIHGAAAATLIYGDTGAGKTTLLSTFIEWVWTKFKVPTRLIAADPGGYSDDILALVAAGLCEVWRLYTRDPLGLLGLPSETLQRACQGWWPAELDPASGECPAGVPLVSPAPDARFAIAFDGLTGMQDWSMVDMGQRSAQGTLGGEGSNMKTVVSGDMKMGVGNRASVGFTQGKARDWVMSSLSIPNLVCPPVFTALELKVLDTETKLPLYGPKIAGQAKTSDVPAWFGATLGVCLARDEKNRPQWRLYLRDYCYPATDPTPHKCKIRASAALPSAELAKLPEFLADGPEDAPLTHFNLGFLFDQLEIVRLTALARVAAQFPDAPGLKGSTIGAPAPSKRVVAATGAVSPPKMPTPAGLVRASAVMAPAAAAVAAVAVSVVAPAAAAPQVAPVAAVPTPPVEKEAPAPAAVSPAPAPARPAAPPKPAPPSPPPVQQHPAPTAPVQGRPTPAGPRPIPQAPVAAAPAPSSRVLPPRVVK